MNILVLLPVSDRHRAILESSAPGEDFIYTSADAATREQVANADVILGNIDPDMLTACEHLQLLQLQTAGYDDYLAAGTVPAEAKLSCSIGAYGQAVSEHMFAMVLSMMKRLPGYQDLQREHRWEDLGPVTSLKNANVLVLGEGYAGPVTVNLAHIPHILLGGSTGSGKSVLLKLLLMQLAQRA